MARFHGKNAQVSLNGTVLTSQSKWSVDMTADTEDASAFGDSHKVHVQGLGDMKGAFDGFYDSDTIAVLLAATNVPDDAPNTLRITPNVKTFPDQFFEGPAWISTTSDGDIKGLAKTASKWVAAPGANWVTPAGTF